MADKPTLGSKLDRMHADLTSIAHRMNVDRSEGTAALAQAAIQAVAALQDDLAGTGMDETDWTWKPRRDRD